MSDDTLHIWREDHCPTGYTGPRRYTEEIVHTNLWDCPCPGHPYPSIDGTPWGEIERLRGVPVQLRTIHEWPKVAPPPRGKQPRWSVLDIENAVAWCQGPDGRHATEQRVADRLGMGDKQSIDDAFKRESDTRDWQTVNDDVRTRRGQGQR